MQTPERIAADLVVENPDVNNPTPEVGEVVYFDATIRNRGAGILDPTTYSLYRSDDSLISEADILLRTGDVGALSTSKISVEVIGISVSRPGRFWLGICVSSVSDEADTSNQCSEGVLVEVTGASTTSVLSVSKTGQGTVVSEPAGIDCGSDCSAPFADGALVSLTHVRHQGGRLTAGKAPAAVVKTARLR